jgi:hypothetical protein
MFYKIVRLCEILSAFFAVVWFQADMSLLIMGQRHSEFKIKIPSFSCSSLSCTATAAVIVGNDSYKDNNILQTSSQSSSSSCSLPLVGREPRARRILSSAPPSKLFGDGVREREPIGQLAGDQRNIGDSPSFTELWISLRSSSGSRRLNFFWICWNMSRKIPFLR